MATQQAIHQELYAASLALDSNRLAAAKRLAAEFHLNHRWRVTMDDIFADSHRVMKEANARLKAALAE